MAIFCSLPLTCLLNVTKVEYTPCFSPAFSLQTNSPSTKSKYYEGLVVQENQYISPTYVAANFTEAATESSPIYKNVADWDYCVLMPTALAIDYSGVKDFEVKSLLETTDKAWVEYETTDFTASYKVQFIKI